MPLPRYGRRHCQQDPRMIGAFMFRKSIALNYPANGFIDKLRHKDTPFKQHRHYGALKKN